MKLVTFDPFRTIGMPNVLYIKPEMVFRYKKEIEEADWLLFPEYWQVNFLVYGLKKRIFPSINSYHLGHDKIEMTRAMWAVYPEHVPYTLILPSNETNLELIMDEMTFPFIAKEVRNSQGKGVYLIENKSHLEDYASANRILYIQERLPLDRDLRVVFVGDQVLTAYWRIGQEGDFRNNLAQGGKTSFANIPVAALELVSRIANNLGINHAGFDLAVVDGHYYILEFNILFGNQALRQRNIPVEAAIWRYLQSQTFPDFPISPDFCTKKIS